MALLQKVTLDDVKKTVANQKSETERLANARSLNPSPVYNKPTYDVEKNPVTQNALQGKLDTSDVGAGNAPTGVKPSVTGDNNTFNKEVIDESFGMQLAKNQNGKLNEWYNRRDEAAGKVTENKVGNVKISSDILNNKNADATVRNTVLAYNAKNDVNKGYESKRMGEMSNLGNATLLPEEDRIINDIERFNAFADKAINNLNDRSSSQSVSDEIRQEYNTNPEALRKRLGDKNFNAVELAITGDRNKYIENNLKENGGRLSWLGGGINQYAGGVAKFLSNTENSLNSVSEPVKQALTAGDEQWLKENLGDAAYKAVMREYNRHNTSTAPDKVSKYFENTAEVLMDRGQMQIQAAKDATKDDKMVFYGLGSFSEKLVDRIEHDSENLRKELGDKNYEAVVKEYNNAKQNDEITLSEIENLAIDAGVSMEQMAIDAAFTLLTGVNGLVAMFMRASGSSQYEAEQNMLNQARGQAAWQAMESGKGPVNLQDVELTRKQKADAYLYGQLAGAVEVGTELLGNFNGALASTYGKGLVDSMTKGQMEVLTQAVANKVAKSSMGKSFAYNIAKLIPSFASEAVEEIIAGIADPLIAKAVYDPDAKIEWSEVWHDGLVGGLVGALTGGASAVMQNNATKPYNNKATLQSLVDVAKSSYKENTPAYQFAKGVEANINSEKGVTNAEVLDLIEIMGKNDNIDADKNLYRTTGIDTSKLNANDEIDNQILDFAVKAKVQQAFDESSEIYKKNLADVTDEEKATIAKNAEIFKYAIASDKIDAGIKPYLASSITSAQHYTSTTEDVNTQRAGKQTGSTFTYRVTESDTLPAEAQGADVITEHDNGTVDYIFTDNFDGSQYPTITKIVTKDAKGNFRNTTPKTKRIINDKSTLVGEDYTGFDVNAQKEAENYWKKGRERTGLSYDVTRMNDKTYFDNYMKAVKGKEEQEARKAEEAKKAQEAQAREEEGVTNESSSNPEERRDNLGGQEAGGRNEEEGIAERGIKRISDLRARYRVSDKSATRLKQVDTLLKKVQSNNLAEVDASEFASDIGGAEGHKVVPLDEKTSKQFAKTTKKLKDLGFENVKYFVGPLYVAEGDTVFDVNGAVSDDYKTVYIRADNLDYTADQIAKHESYHRILAMSNGMLDAMWARLDQEKANEILKKYKRLYNDNGANLSDRALKEEILCDAYGLMNMFATGKGAEIFQQSIVTNMQDVLNTINEITSDNVNNSVEQAEPESQQNAEISTAETTSEETAQEEITNQDVNSKDTNVDTRDDDDILKDAYDHYASVIKSEGENVDGKFYLDVSAIDDTPFNSNNADFDERWGTDQIDILSKLSSMSQYNIELVDNDIDEDTGKTLPPYVIYTEGETKYSRNIGEENGNREEGLRETSGRGVWTGQGRNGTDSADAKAGAEGRDNIRKDDIILLGDDIYDTLRKKGKRIATIERINESQYINYEEAMIEARKIDIFGWCVDVQTEQGLKDSGAKVFTFDNGNAGIAVEPDGNIVGFFRNKANRALNGVSFTAMSTAINNGGIKCDNFGKDLVDIYAQFGMVPVARTKFDFDFAMAEIDGYAEFYNKFKDDPNFKGDLYPDIYFMMYNGKPLTENLNGKKPEWSNEALEALPTMDYDAAAEYRDSIIEYNKALDNKDYTTARKIVDKVAKQNGYDIKAYHGTPEGGFTTFNDWSYFTANKNYAERYTNSGASSISTKTSNKNPKVYEVYIKADNIFDTRNKREREIFNNEFYRQWGTGTPIGEKGLPDWTDGMDLVEFLEESGYDYDAILLDEGGDGGYGEEVVDRGISIVVKDSTQVKSADVETFDNDGNRIPLNERFNNDSDDIRYSRNFAPTFYSRIQKEIEAFKGDRIGAESVVPYLLGKKLKNMEDEIKWSGIEAFLEGKKSVSKQELIDFLKANQLQIQVKKLGVPFDENLEEYNHWTKKLETAENELVQGQKEYRDVIKKVTDSLTDAYREINNNHNFVVGDKLASNANYAGLLAYLVSNELSSNPESYVRTVNAIKTIQRYNKEEFINPNKSSDIAKSITALNAHLDEWEAQLREAHSRIARAEVGINKANLNLTTIPETRWKGHSAEGGTNYREYLYKLPNSEYSNDAMEQHWRDEGVLVHARLQDMVAPDGSKVLFIDEIQSDWHNAGSKYGYKLNEKDYNALKERRNQIIESGTAQKKKHVKYYQQHIRDIADVLLGSGEHVSPMREIANTDVSELNINSEEERERVLEFQNLYKQFWKYKEELDSIDWRLANNDSLTPDAPFSNAYTDFVLKNLVREAAEKGYDYIAWTDSEMQLDRWNDARRTNLQMFGPDSEYYKAEKANKIAFQEGYQKEYDKEIPKYLNRFGKPFGSSVEVKQFGNSKEYKIDSMDDAVNYIKIAQYHSGSIRALGETDTHYAVTDETGEIFELKKGKVYKTGNGFKTFAMPITESMKESVLYKGQPMFSRNVAESNKTELRLENDYLKEQVKNISGSEHLNNIKPNDVANTIKSMYGSKYSQETISSAVDQIKSYVNDRISSGSDIRYDDLKNMAMDVARNVVWNSSALTDSEGFKGYSKLSNIVTNTKVSLPKNVSAKIANYEMWKTENVDNISIASDGIPVQELYARLNSTFGDEMFPKSMKTQYKQALRIADVMQAQRDIFEDLYSRDIEIMSEYCANDIINSFVEQKAQTLGETALTPLTERISRRRENALNQANEALRSEPESNTSAYTAGTHVEVDEEGNEKEVFNKRSDKSAWTETNRTNENAKVLTPLEIIDKISHDFGVNITTGHVKGNGILGLFMKNNKGIRIKFANQIPEATHELGHALDNRYSLLKNLPDEAKKELNSNPTEQMNRAKTSERMSEGVADYFRLYLMNKDYAQTTYPELTKYIMNLVDAPTKISLSQLADGVNAYYVESMKTAKPSIRSRKDGIPDFRTPAEKLKDWYDGFYNAWVDANNGILKYDRDMGTNVYTLATNAAYADARAWATIVGDMFDFDGNYTGTGLKAALLGINLEDEVEYKDFNEYLVVSHGPEFMRETGGSVFGNPIQDNAKWMDSRKAELESQYSEFKDAAERLYDFQKRLLQTYAVDTGLISKDTFDQWAKRWNKYVPFNRVVPTVGGGGNNSAKAGFANQTSTFRSAKGSTLELYDPLDNIVTNIVKMVNAGVRNNVMQAITKSAEALEADARFIEKIDTPVRGSLVHLEAIKERLGRNAEEAILNKFENGDDIVDVVQAEIDALDDVITQFTRGNGKSNEVAVMIDGKPQYWKVNDPLLLKSITSLAPTKVEGIIEAYAMTSRMMTANITGNNFIWSITRNAPKDLITFINFSKVKNPIKMFSAIGNAYWNQIKDAGDFVTDPYYAEYVAMGGAKTSAYTADINLTQNAIEAMRGTEPSIAKRLGHLIKHPIKASGKGAKEFFAHPWEAISSTGEGIFKDIETLSNIIEVGPRFATYKMLRDNGASPQEAFYESNDVTVNFRRGGRLARQTNKFVPFFNANVQGIDKFVRYYTAADVTGAGKAKAVASRLTFLVTTSAVMASIVAGFNFRDDDDKEQYSRLSVFTKNNYWLIPLSKFGIAQKGKYLALPKARELGIVSSFIERCMEYYATGNKHAFDDFDTYSTSNLLPAGLAEIAEAALDKDVTLVDALGGMVGNVGVFGIASYLYANKDFLGRDIVPESLQNRLAIDQYKGSTSKVAYHLAPLFGEKLSPIQIDYIGESIFGNVWKPMKAVMPMDDFYKDKSLGIKNSWIKDNQHSNDIVNWIYDYVTEAEKWKNHEETPDNLYNYAMSNNIKSFYSSYYSLTKEMDETVESRAYRGEMLAMLEEFRDEMDKGAYASKELEAVANLCKEYSDMSMLPAVMGKEIADVDDSKTKYPLNYKQYYEYQNRYNAYYYQLVGQTFDRAADEDEKVLTLLKIKDIAKELATNDIRKSMGIKESNFNEKYAGMTPADAVMYRTYLKEAGDDGSTKGYEYADSVYKLGLGREESYNAYKNLYSSANDSNNPWSSKYANVSPELALEYIRRCSTEKTKSTITVEERKAILRSMNCSNRDRYYLYNATDTSKTGKNNEWKAYK